MEGDHHGQFLAGLRAVDRGGDRLVRVPTRQDEVLGDDFVLRGAALLTGRWLAVICELRHREDGAETDHDSLKRKRRRQRRRRPRCWRRSAFEGRPRRQPSRWLRRHGTGPGARILGCYSAEGSRALALRRCARQRQADSKGSLKQLRFPAVARASAHAARAGARLVLREAGLLATMLATPGMSQKDQ